MSSTKHLLNGLNHKKNLLGNVMKLLFKTQEEQTQLHSLLLPTATVVPLVLSTLLPHRHHIFGGWPWSSRCITQHHLQHNFDYCKLYI